MIKNILLIISLIALGLYGISVVPTLDERMQVAVVVSLISVIALATIYPKVDFDFKLLLICIAGYILSGRRFAYLSPFQPVFIGEICLGVGFIMVLGRLLARRWWGKLFDTPVHIAIWLLLIYGALRVYVDLPRYGLLVFKDAATIYYALFFLIAYIWFESSKNRIIFHKFIVWILVFAFIATYLRSFSSMLPSIVHPHKDATISAITACIITLYFKGLQSRELKWFVLLIMAFLGIILSLQMSFIAALCVAGLVICIRARKYQLLYLLTIGMIGIGVFFLILSAMDSPLAATIVREFNTIDLSTIDSKSFQRSTSGWRLAWWSAIWDETMQVNPWFGLGLGADLGSEFTLRYYGVAAGESGNLLFGAARYPHNILFTMIGRFGLLGASLFMIYIFTVVFYLGRFINLYCRKSVAKVDLTHIAIVCYVIAGAVNSFLQCTYEAPYAAIPYWVVVAYMVHKVKQNSKYV